MDTIIYNINEISEVMWLDQSELEDQANGVLFINLHLL